MLLNIFKEFRCAQKNTMEPNNSVYKYYSDCVANNVVGKLKTGYSAIKIAGKSKVEFEELLNNNRLNTYVGMIDGQYYIFTHDKNFLLELKLCKGIYKDIEFDIITSYVPLKKEGDEMKDILYCQAGIMPYELHLTTDVNKMYFYATENGKSRFLIDKFAEYFISSNHIKMNNKTLYIYKNGHYNSDDNYLKCKINQLYQKNMRKNMVDEVIEHVKWILSELDYCEPFAEAKYISFKNGVLNIETMELLPHSPEFFVPNMIPWNYNPNAYDDLLNDVLNSWSNNVKTIRTQLEEMFGYCMYRDLQLRGGAYFLKGDRHTGKSTCLELLQYMLDKNNGINCTNNKLDKLIGNKGDFRIATLQNKLVNFDDDCSDILIQDSSLFKQLVTGATITSNVKYSNRFPSFCNTANFVCATNDMMRLGNGRDKAAILSRISIIPFNNYYGGSSDLSLKQKLFRKESIEYMIKIGIDAFRNALLRGCLTESEEAKKEKLEYECDLDNVFLWLDSTAPVIVGKKSITLFGEYCEWCKISNNSPVNLKTFHTRLNKILAKEFTHKRSNSGNGNYYSYTKK